jgi:diadenosine tetraphosphatase ApaH/serine/threonine PP2A family protein phosphatase
MRYLILSDIHANLEALEAVLTRARGAYEATLVLGDLVGYGADPNAVVERIRAMPDTTILRGNHDKVAAGIASTETFNPVARDAVLWTAEVLTADNRAWLAGLATGPLLIDDLVEICHGAPFDEDEYLFNEHDARKAFPSVRRPLCLYGHTHVPACFQHPAGLPMDQPRGREVEYTLAAGTTYLVNCWAVGQPRDNDPRAAIGLLDTATRRLSLLRVPYDVAAAQRKILAHGLPEVLAQRLGVGR